MQTKRPFKGHFQLSKYEMAQLNQTEWHTPIIPLEKLWIVMSPKHAWATNNALSESRERHRYKTGQ